MENPADVAQAAGQENPADTAQGRGEGKPWMRVEEFATGEFIQIEL